MNLQEVLQSDIRIPSTPAIMPRLQALLQDPDTGSANIGDLLKMDVGLTTRVMRMANSPFYRLAMPAQSIEEAINFLGYREVYRAVSIAATETIMGSALPNYNTAAGEMLEHSVAVARMMAIMGRRNGAGEPDTYYTIGLLHAIGKIVIDQCLQCHGLSFYGGETGGVDAYAPATVCLDEEQALLGFTHVEAGASLLDQWQFPEEIILPVRYQFSPPRAEHQQVAAHALSLCRYLAPALIHADPELIDADAFPVERENMVAAALNPQSWERILTDCARDLQQLHSLLA